MFKAIVMSACLAGLSAGVVLTVVQQPTVAPIIFAAEIYEAAAAPTQVTHQHDDLHAHDDVQAWAPDAGIERTLWSLVTNVSAAIGFALLLCAVYTLLPSITAAGGVCWGLAGFVVFFANPGIGLHPEIPGTSSADLFDRQLWWIFTAICSAAAVALIAWQRTRLTWGAAAALLVLPHLFGAPQPTMHGGVAPQVLAVQFVWATVFVNAVFWLMLGLFSALIFRHLAPPPDTA